MKKNFITKKWKDFMKDVYKCRMLNKNIITNISNLKRKKNRICINSKGNKITIICNIYLYYLLQY